MYLIRSQNTENVFLFFCNFGGMLYPPLVFPSYAIFPYVTSLIDYKCTINLTWWCNGLSLGEMLKINNVRTNVVDIQ